MSKIVTVISGKGGSGKTTLAVNLAVGLRMLGKKTLLIDCSFGVRNDDSPLGVTNQLVYNLSDVISESVRFEDAVACDHREHIPDFVGASVSPLPDNFKPRFSRFISNASRHYEYIIIDTPSSTGIETSVSVLCADVVLAICGTDILSVQNTSLCVSRLSSDSDVRLVLNDVSSSSDDDRFVEDIIDEVGVPLIGMIRYDEFVPQSLQSGDPIVRYNTFAGREIENIVSRLDNQHIDLSKKMSNERIFTKNKLVLKITSRRV